MTHTPRPHRTARPTSGAPGWTGVPVSRRALLAGAGGAGLAALLAACTSASPSTPRSSGPVTSGTPSTGASGTPTTSPASTTPADPTSSSAAPARTVTVRSFIGDGALLGVGMPVILSFDPTPTDASAFVKAAKVTVNGQPADGAWHWIKRLEGFPVEAHYRLRDYWPANSTIKVELPIGGLSAGRGLAYDGALTSVTFRTGDKRVTTVDGRSLRATVEVNDKVVRTMEVSLGASQTPTYTGTKLVMQKGEDIPGTSTLRPDGAVRMQNTAHTYDEIVPWSVRITTSGEYLHAAAWNSRIGQVSTSNGCTNLSTANGEWFYNFARIGDVVIHRNTGGDPVPAWDGYADWNTPWSTWVKGGLLPPT